MFVGLRGVGGSMRAHYVVRNGGKRKHGGEREALDKKRGRKAGILSGRAAAGKGRGSGILGM